MRLAALSAEERAFLTGTGEQGTPLAALSMRVRGALTAALGARVEIEAATCVFPPSGEPPGTPRIVPNAAMIDCWVSLRFGGAAGAVGRTGSTAFVEPLVRVLARAWAETVINLGPGVTWPQAMRFDLSLGGQAGAFDVQACPRRLMAWAVAFLENKR